LKKKLNLLFRLLITLTLSAYFFTKIEINTLWNVLKQINPWLFLFSSFLYILSSYISTLRWKLFIPSTAKLKTSKLFSLYLIGCFFNIFLPGSMGGDAVKVLILRRKIGLQEALSSVFIERYIGFVSLLFLGLLFFLLFFTKIKMHSTLYIVPASLILFLIGTFILLAIGKFSFLRNAKNYVISLVKKFFFKGFIYSLLVQVIVMVSVYIIFFGLKLNVAFYEVVIYLPVIIIMATLPISISGIGVREWGFIMFFSNSIGNENAIAVSILWFLSTVFASLIGGVEYLRFKDFLDIKKEYESL